MVLQHVDRPFIVIMKLLQRTWVLVTDLGGRAGGTTESADRGYLRTSTDDQHLGIDAQLATLERICGERGCEIVLTFSEHESGGDNQRLELINGGKGDITNIDRLRGEGASWPCT